LVAGLSAGPDDLTGPVNLGNPGAFSMIALAETIIELTGSRSALVHEALPQDDPKQRKPTSAWPRRGSDGRRGWRCRMG
jgi:UDP-glucuronate decarboxylase